MPYRTAVIRLKAATSVGAALVTLVLTGPASAQSEDDQLIAELRDGGYVIVMRHASSPTELPGPRERVPGNVRGERQLDEHGIATLVGMRFAFRELGIPVGDVYSSPAWRARETALHFGFGKLTVAEELGSEDMAAPPQSSIAWLLGKTGETPPEGTNTVIITHGPQLRAAFGADGEALEAGDALILRPDGETAELVRRMPILDWPGLALD